MEMAFEQPLRARTRGFRTGLALLAACTASCDIGSDGTDSVVRPKTFAAVNPLTAAQVDAIVQAAALSSDTPDVAIAVLDRIGNLLGLYLRGVSATAGNTPDYSTLTAADQSRLNFATAVARAAAFLSHSQAPLTSRTGQFLSSFHFPVVFDTSAYLTAPPFSFPGTTLPVQETIGVTNTAQAPLWQIEASNRGVTFETAATMPVTAYNLGAAIPLTTNPDGSAPSPGLGLLPGGIPLYDRAEGGSDVGRRLIGAIGVYVTDPGGLPLPDLAEFMAIEGARTGPNFDFGVRPEGAVFLVGVLLPATDADPAGTGPGSFDPVDRVTSPALLAGGQPDPGEQYLIGPVSSAPGATSGGLTDTEVMTIIDSCRQVSQETHAAIRLPSDSPCQMFISVCDLDGVLLGVYRERDTTLFSLEISITKARNAAFFSNPLSRWTSDVTEAGVLAGLHPLTGFRARRDTNGDPLPILDAAGNLISANGDVVDIFPPLALTTGPGIAVTARTLGFLTQPFYPPGIDGSPQPGPLFFLVQKNRDPAAFEGQGFAARFGSLGPNTPRFDDTQSGIIFFPGSAALYRNGVLVGGIGVSGDGVEQDDFVTAEGLRRAEAQLGFDLDPPLRASDFAFEGTPLPYFKFPQNPGG